MFLIAAAYAIALIVGSPYVGQIRAAVRAAFPDQFQVIVGGTIAVAIAAALLATLTRVRERRAVRYGLLATALAVGIVYAHLHATGDPEVDVVERFHFVEYGLLTLLFYRAWRPSDDASSLILPVLAGLIVGTLDEWFQWFIPSRVGEMRDVALDAVAVVCGLCFSVADDPPTRFTPAVRPDSVRRVGRWTAITVIVFSVFFATIHLGHEIADKEFGTFRSRYTRAELEQASEDRSARWRVQPPAGSSGISREDQYLSEGLWHVRRRNQAWTDGDPFTSWRENRILEEFFAPVLDTGSASGVGQRWSPEQQADAAAHAGAADRPYASTANPYPIYTWPQSVFWMVTAAVTLAIVALTNACSRPPLDA